MKIKLISLLIFGVFIVGCGSGSSKDSNCKGSSKFQIDNQCVTEEEKNNFDLLTTKPYYKKQTYHSGETYTEWDFTKEAIYETTNSDGIDVSSETYPWGLEKNKLLIDLGEGKHEFKVEKINDSTISIYSYIDNCTQLFYDNSQDALSDNKESCI